MVQLPKKWLSLFRGGGGAEPKGINITFFLNPSLSSFCFQTILLCCQFLIFCGIIMGSYIFFRLCRIKHSNFINIIMIFCFGTEVLLGSCMNYFLFESGRKNLLDETNDSEKVLEDCKYYITTFMSYWIIQPIFYTLVIFTRFIFVRYVIKKMMVEIL